MIRRTPPLSALWKYSEKSPKIYVRPIIFPCLSRREITGRLHHRPSIIYIEEYPWFLPAFLHTSRPDIFLYKFWSVFKTRSSYNMGKGGLPVMKIRWAPSRGHISHRCTQIVQGVLQKVSHSQINIYYCLTNSALSKKETPRWQGLYRTAFTPFQIWWDWSLDFFLYVLFLDGLHSIPTNTYIAASFFSKQAGEEGGGSPLSEYLRFYLL
jgi:hypothetical protein